MSEIIFHHYALSPFSEKIRRILAFKSLPWRSVDQPIMMPKPELVALTGGYRRIPVLQIGADVYCDTALIARCLEKHFPSPTIVPAAEAGLIGMLEDWADHRLFFQCVPPVIKAIFDQLPPGFLDDRAAMSPALTKEGLFAAAPQAWAQAQLSLDRLERQLACSTFLLGEQFTLADAACYNPVWFLKHDAALFAEVEARAALFAWFKRIEAMPDEQVQEMTCAQSLAVARDSTPVAPMEPSSGTNGEFTIGDQAAVAADDYGPERTSGRITAISAESVTIERADPDLGAVAVHFPRAGYRVLKL